MSKIIIQNALNLAKNTPYIWNMYFFKIDRRHANSYECYKVRFKRDQYLPDYANKLINTINTFTLNDITTVLNYDGYNTKVSCDKLSINDPLIQQQYTLLMESIVYSNEAPLKSSYHGYILSGSSVNPDQNGQTSTIMFIKLANPIIKLNTKKSTVLINTPTNELDTITDDVLRLFLTTDCIITNNTLYAFNHSFEKLFHLEKTLHKAKQAAIQKIVSVNIASNNNDLETYLNQVTNSRIFISLDDERLSRIQSTTERSNISNITGVSLNTSNEFIISSKDDAERLLKYLCMKYIQEKETNYIYEGNTLIKKN